MFFSRILGAEEVFTYGVKAYVHHILFGCGGILGSIFFNSIRLYHQKKTNSNMGCTVFQHEFLGGGLTHFLFSPLFGEIIQFDGSHIFQMG